MKSITLQRTFNLQTLFALFIAFLFQSVAIAETNASEVSCYNDWGVKLYGYTNYKGDYQCYKPGEYIVSRDCRSYLNRRISIKIRPGYYVCFYDRSGRLLKKYDRDLNYIQCNYYKLCIRKNNDHGYPPGHGNPGHEADCFQDWCVKLYDGHHYNGSYKCFRPGEYYAGKHCGTYYGKKISFKIRKGYYVCFYDRYGKIIKKAYGDTDYYPHGFHKFCILKVDNHGGGYGQEPECFQDWSVKLYEGQQYNGSYKCFRPGEYYAGKHCGTYYGKKISFKIRKGYYVCFYDRHGKLIKKAYGNINYYTKGFYKFCIYKEGHNNGHHEEVNCYSDWGFKLFGYDHYKGTFKCFRPGTYYVGKHCNNYNGKKISFKVRDGYQVSFYDRYGKLIKDCYGNYDYYVEGFYKFVVKKKGHYGHNDGGHGGATCAQWCVKIYGNGYCKGTYECLPYGTYYAGKSCNTYSNRKTISFEVQKGYEVQLYDRYGRLIRKCHGRVEVHRSGFHKLIVKKARYGYGD